jgi:hypothetical protein
MVVYCIRVPRKRLCVLLSGKGSGVQAEERVPLNLG